MVVGVLDNIRSAYNVGSIFRTADGAGFTKLYLCGVTPCPVDQFGRVNEKIHKVALGAEKTIAWEYRASTARAINVLKKQGFLIYALEKHLDSLRYDKVSIQKDTKIALVVGNEIEGLSSAILKKVHNIIEIPMKGSKESLNVSVAFGIAAYAITKNTP